MKKIFVSIASYQDPLLLETICSAYENAKYKDFITFGVCEQSSNGIDLDSIKFKNQIRYELIDPVMAKGPCYARSRIQSLINGEDYYLQIDSHMIFYQDWDEILIKYFNWLQQHINNDLVITGYPRSFKANESLDEFELNIKYKDTLGITFREGRIFEDGHYSMQKSYPANTDLPVQGLLVAGGFIFSETTFSKKIPYDPKLYFHGEELSLALRLFTHGWSVTHIPRVPIFHLYTDVKNLVRKLHWNEEDEKHRAVKWNELDRLSKSRLTDLIFSRVEEPFGLGTKRTVQEFINICGIDLFNKEVIDIDIATNNFPFKKIDSENNRFAKIKIENE